MIPLTDPGTQLDAASKKTEETNLECVERESVAFVTVRTEQQIALARIRGSKNSFIRLCFRIILYTSQLPRREAGGRGGGGDPLFCRLLACKQPCSSAAKGMVKKFSQGS